MDTSERRRAPDGHDARGHRSVRPVVSIVTMLLGALGEVLRELGTGQPPSAARWALLIVGALLGSVVLVLAAGFFDRLLGWWAASWAWLRRGARTRAVVTTVVVCSLALPLGWALPIAAGRVQRYLHGCPQPTEVRVLTSLEQRGAVRELADAYRTWTADGNRGCPTVHPYVYAASPSEAREALANGWYADALRRIGPRPDVWLADSTVEVARVVADAPRFGITLPIAERASVATSPLVLGVPAGQLPPELRSQRRALVWPDLWARVAALPGGVVRPDPNVSLVGELGSMALYLGIARATGPTGGTPPDSAILPAPSVAREIERFIDRSLDAGGYPLGSNLDVFCRQRQLGTSAAAVITTEQALVRFNQGHAGGDGCAAPAGPPAPEAALVGFYPPDTLSTDHPFVRLLWDGPASAQARATADLSRWLRGADGHRALVRLGLRPAALATVGDPLSDGLGALDSPSYDHRPPSSETAARILDRYTEARRPGRVLLAVDASGSMAAEDRDGASRLAAAVRGVRTALSLMSARDEFGLWVFRTDARGAAPRVLVPVGPRDAKIDGTSRRQLALSRLVAESPGGNTPLHDTIVAGVRAVRSREGVAVTSLVVLTDGRDTASDIDPAEVDRRVRGQGVRVFVVAIGEASCTERTLRDVTGHTGGACLDAGADGPDAVLAELFDLLWGGANES